MVKITRVYTKKGDKGNTSATQNTRLSKNSLQVEAFGILDEFNSFLGWIATAIDNDLFFPIKAKLYKIQNTLFDMGAFLFTRKRKDSFQKYIDGEVKALEENLDEMNNKLSSLSSFILPGGNEISARFHIARAVCRRLERTLVALEENNNETTLIPYINRLSDWLFVTARYVTSVCKTDEMLWEPAFKD